MGKKEITERRTELVRRKVRISADDIILVGVLLAFLQLGHFLAVGWIGTLLSFLGYVIGEIILKLFRKS